MMERVSDERLNEMVELHEMMDELGLFKVSVFGRDVLHCLQELQACRKAEKEQKSVEANLESVKPLPVKRCKIDGVEHDAKDWTVKQWFQKN